MDAKPRSITVIVSPDGKIVVEASGFSGRACLAATAELNRLLTGPLAATDMKPEAFETLQNTVETKHPR